MASYKVGIKTRAKIIKTAKRLFYEKGYGNVSVTEICRIAEIKLGTFTYHFKTKDQLVQHIYQEYMRKVWDYTASLLHTNDGALLHIHAISLYYFNIYNDPNIAAFHSEIYHQLSMNDILENAEILCRCFMDPNDPFIADSHIMRNLVIADNGCRRELNLKFMSSHPQPRLDDVIGLIRDVYFVTGRLFCFPIQRIEGYIDDCRAFLLEHLDSNLRLIP